LTLSLLTDVKEKNADAVQGKKTKSGI